MGFNLAFKGLILPVIMHMNIGYVHKEQ